MDPPSLPRLSRVELFTASDDQLLCALGDAIARYTGEALLSEQHLALLAWGRLLVDVPNGGFAQFFLNHKGEHGIARLGDLLESQGRPKPAGLLRKAAALYQKHRERFATSNLWDGRLGSIEELELLDRKFVRSGLAKASGALARWARAHLAELVVGDDGQPIDQLFSGSVEIHHANGQLACSLEVRKGKADGPWREFFDDGTVRQLRFFKAGKPSAEFWSTGQLKFKQAKWGIQKVLEWYYPSGSVHKRIVLDRSGEYAEPVRLYHENGQLAEEMTVRSGQRGRWLKFFPDGAPELQAESALHGSEVIHNAWDGERRQVVKDGTGVFDDDGRRIFPTYALFFESPWRRRSELVGGVPNGTCTTYHRGVLWSITPHVGGTPHGESLLYWDNGRVRTRTTYAWGKEVGVQQLPKFDHPVPAVRLTLQANPGLYSAWQHLPVDEYPVVQNLDEVQALLQIPPFLQEVYVRNQTENLQGEYEDWNTLEDGIAYFLQVDEAGNVVEAHANGSDPLSVVEWNTYPPLLGRLRFLPGRIRGRAVPCRVLATVEHTFAESS